ncbi:MAG: hypothetical protein NTW59_05390, partial [Candidatus Diapherotrites archaeon]|nr:hypothetical protein [Candidatus Diapherotrites archaeon]
MGKRIWKRPGSAAWKRAVRKSASRMARDLSRIPRKKETLAVQDYVRNKDPLQAFELVRKDLVSRARERRVSIVEHLLDMMELRSRQSRVVMDGIKRNLRKRNRLKRAGRSGLAEARKIRTAARVQLANTRAEVEDLKWIAKNMPKRDETLVRESIRKYYAREIERAER